MKFMKQILYFTALSAALSMGLAACGKSSDSSSGLNSGSLTSDGQSVASTTTVGGYQMSLNINNIVSYSNGCYNSSYCQTQLGYVVSLNNQQKQLQSQPQYGGQTGRQQGNIGGFNVLTSSACYDQTCRVIAIEVVVGTGYESLQVIVKKDMVDNKIVNIKENRANNMYSIRTLQQAMTEL